MDIYFRPRKHAAGHVGRPSGTIDALVPEIAFFKRVTAPVLAPRRVRRVAATHDRGDAKFLHIIPALVFKGSFLDESTVLFKTFFAAVVI